MEPFVWEYFLNIPIKKAYKNCQELLDKHILPHFKDFNTKVVGSRGIVVHEF